MDIKPLLDLTCATVASMIKGKTPEEIRRYVRTDGRLCVCCVSVCVYVCV
jgi:hypothetical protein